MQCINNSNNNQLYASSQFTLYFKNLVLLSDVPQEK